MAWTIPKTWNVGDVLTSTDLNTYVRDNSSFLYGDTNEVAVTIASGWANFGGGFLPLNVRKFGSFGVVSGLVFNNSGVTTNYPSTMGTLPIGYQPAATAIASGIVGSSPIVLARIDIGFNATISIQSAAAGTGIGNAVWLVIPPSIYTLI